VPPYLDVNSDGFVGPQDVLEIVNFINSRSSGGGSGAEGEGEAAGDLWISAYTPAPMVESNSKSSSHSTTTPANTSGVRSLDSYLATIGSQMGPALPTSEVDLGWVAEGESTQPADDRWAVAMGDILDDLF
jgi:hypothetical protein